MLTEDELATDPTVRQLVAKLAVYRAGFAVAIVEAARLRAERDALKDEVRRYVAARVPEC